MPFKSLGAVSYSPSIVTVAVSVAFCEIFNVKEWCDLENRVRVSSRSLKMAPFDRSPTSSYSPSIVTMAISCIVCDLLVENRKIFIPHLYLAPRTGWPRRNFVTMFDGGKTGMIGLPRGKKKYDNMFSRFHTIPASPAASGSYDSGVILRHNTRARFFETQCTSLNIVDNKVTFYHTTLCIAQLLLPCVVRLSVCHVDVMCRTAKLTINFFIAWWPPSF